MKKINLITSIFLSAFISLNCYAQNETIVNILGISTYNLLPESIIVELIFEENGRSCGPNTNFETLGEQVAFFFEEYKNAGLGPKSKYEEIERIKDYAKVYKMATYSFMVKDEKTAKEIYELGRYSFAEKIIFYYKYPVGDHLTDIEGTQRALENAGSKVSVLMKAINKKSVELISTNDDVQKGSWNYSKMDKEGKVKIGKYTQKEIIKQYRVQATYRIR